MPPECCGAASAARTRMDRDVSRPDRAGACEVGGRAAGVDRVLARGDDPLAVDPRGERPPVERDVHPARLARPQLDTPEPGQMAQRACRVAARRLDVDLDHLAAGALARVGDLDVDGDAVLDAAGDGGRAEGERRVAEPEAEREQRLDALPVVPAVTDEQPLGVDGCGRRCRGGGRTPACPRCAAGTSSAAGLPARRRRSARRRGRRRSPGRGTTAAARPARRRATASSPASRS